MQGDATPRETLEPSTAEITGRLIDVIGRKLTAYIGNVNDVRALELWAAGEAMSEDAFVRLRFAFQLVQTLQEAESPAIIQAWLMGINPDLDDRVPIRLMRQQDLETVGPDIFRAARTFLAEGRSSATPS
jgi:hypothetical protein